MNPRNVLMAKDIRS